MSDSENRCRIALFAGSFDPFTAGHQRIVQRALNIFDKVVVAVGQNSGKNAMFPIEERIADIAALYNGDDRVHVVSYSGLTVDFAKSVGATSLLRGVRSVKDFEYERDLADINMRLAGIDTCFLVSEPEYAAVSSSVVRELLSYGKDVAVFMPVANVINE